MQSKRRCISPPAFLFSSVRISNYITDDVRDALRPQRRRRAHSRKSEPMLQVVPTIRTALGAPQTSDDGKCFHITSSVCLPNLLVAVQHRLTISWSRAIFKCAFYKRVFAYLFSIFLNSSYLSHGSRPYKAEWTFS